MYKKINNWKEIYITRTILAYIGTEGFQLLYKKVSWENYEFFLVYVS